MEAQKNNTEHQGKKTRHAVVVILLPPGMFRCNFGKAVYNSERPWNKNASFGYTASSKL